MLFHLARPQRTSGRRVERVDESLLVGEVRRVRALTGAAGTRGDGDRRANAAVCGEGPDDASARGVERVHRAVLAADEQPSAGDRRLRPRRRRVGKAEGPLEMQSRDVCGGDAGLCGRLEMRVLERGAPPVPHRHRRDVANRRPPAAETCRDAGDGSAQRSSGEKFSKRAPFVAAERKALIPHRPGRERVEDRLRRAAVQRVFRRRARVVAAVTRAAGAIEQRCGIDRLPLARLTARDRFGEDGDEQDGHRCERMRQAMTRQSMRRPAPVRAHGVGVRRQADGHGIAGVSVERAVG